MLLKTVPKNLSNHGPRVKVTVCWFAICAATIKPQLWNALERRRWRLNPKEKNCRSKRSNEVFGIKTSIDDEAEYQWFSTSSDCESSTLKFNPNFAQLDPMLKLSITQVKLFCKPFLIQNKLRDRFLNHSFIFVKVRDRLFYSTFAFESKASSCFCI